MHAPARRIVVCAYALFSLLLFVSLEVGCKSQTTSQGQNKPKTAAEINAQAPPPPPAPVSPGVSARLHEIATAGTLASLSRPDFSDYRMHFQHAYEPSNFAPLWLNGNQPTPQATAIIALLQNSVHKGLNPDDYDAVHWQGRLDGLKTANDAALAEFDAAVTVGLMRYISDLHIGRVNPTHFNFGIDIETKKYDMPQFVTQDVQHAVDVRAVLDQVEPTYDGYKRTGVALQHYLDLAAKGDGPPVPDVTKSVGVGDAYPGTAQLAARLQLLGDLPANATIVTDAHIYDATLSVGVKSFQERHGLTPDGKLGKDTVAQLNVPLATRVVQLDDALERWRWLPPQFPQPPVVANIPEFVVRAFDADHRVAFSTNVVVGKAMRTQTPVFTKDMKYIIFRPYWNIPPGIVRGEIIPHITKNRGYLATKNMEITDSSGKVITDGAVSDAVLAQLRAGKLMVRQKPGKDNSLGLVKFIFPNDNNVYLHSTPAQELFSRSRRDFSHGCVRVEKPAELAAYLLRDQPPWTLEKVQQAMQSGPDNQQVNLKTPVPVLIFYLTAIVQEDGSVHFFDDIYGHDKSLNAVLAKGPPYPG
ncbi:MAG: L,D-transpeptidase family protein [Silvibacterium sp.]